MLIFKHCDSYIWVDLFPWLYMLISNLLPVGGASSSNSAPSDGSLTTGGGRKRKTRDTTTTPTAKRKKKWLTHGISVYIFSWCTFLYCNLKLHVFIESYAMHTLPITGLVHQAPLCMGGWMVCRLSCMYCIYVLILELRKTVVGGRTRTLGYVCALRRDWRMRTGAVATNK